MRKPGQIKIDDLYFGIVVEDFTAPQDDNDNFLKTINLFGCSRVKWSVAYWVLSDDDFKKEHDFIRWCFGDVWGRCEYEFVVMPLLSNDDRSMKVDAYRMYVEPNERILRQMVDSVSATSAKRYLSAERKRLSR